MPFPRAAVLAALAIVAAAVGPSFAQTKPAQPPAGQAPTGQAPTGQAPAGQAPTGQAAGETDPSKMVVAKVGENTITLADLIAMREELPAQYRQVPLQAIYPALLERAIDGRLIANAARSANLGDRADVQRRIRRAEDQVLSEVYLSESIAEQVTEEAMRKRYDEFASNQSGREEAHARHMLLETEQAAREAIAELEKGASFAEVAKKRSTDPSAAEGGDLGWFTAEQMVPEFSKAAFALKPGEYTKDPVKSQFGWHVILLEEKRTTEAPPFEQVQDQLASEMTRELITSKLKDLREKADIQRFGPDGTPMPAPQ